MFFFSKLEKMAKKAKKIKEQPKSKSKTSESASVVNISADGSVVVKANETASLKGKPEPKPKKPKPPTRPPGLPIEEVIERDPPLKSDLMTRDEKSYTDRTPPRTQQSTSRKVRGDSMAREKKPLISTQSLARQKTTALSDAMQRALNDAKKKMK